MTDGSPSSRHIEGLDGIRGVASLLILFFHGFYGTMIPFFEPAPAWTGAGRWLVTLTEPLSGGVDIFFVLSGFLITRTLYASLPLRASNIGSFYRRRLARLYPLYLVLLLVLGAMGVSLGFLTLALFFLANVADLFQFSTFWLPIWSVAVEIHFYFLWPLLLKLGGKRGLAMLSVLIVFASPWLRMWGFERGDNIYAHTWFRLDGLAAGSWLAWYLLERKPSLEKLRAIAITGLMVFGSAAVLRPDFLNRTVSLGQIYGCELWQILAAGLICGVWARMKITAWLEKKFWVKMGLWSYGVFLIHPVLFHLCRQIEKHRGLSAAGESWEFICLRFVVVVLISTILGAFSFHAYEKPVYRFLTRPRRGRH